jgi:hypothetical protein
MSDDTATIERELEAVETALGSGDARHPDPSARALQELALTLTAEAPTPRPEFAEELRGQVERGFPKRARKTRKRRPLHPLVPLAGAGAVALIAVLALTLNGGNKAETLSATDDAGGGGAVSSSDETLAAPAPADKGFAPGQANRRIERTFSMELSVPVDEMTRVADEVNSVAYRHGGFVLSSSVDSGDDGGGGDFALRIPTNELRPALRDLAKLAPVTNQSQEGRDVTRQHVTAKDRLQAARAERRSLLRRLAEAATDEEAEAIRRRLDLVSGQINGLRAQLRDLRLRTNYAVVNVTLGEAHKDKGELGSFGDSLDDAGNLLAGFAGVTIRVLALALPLGVIALLGWLTGRVLRRRRRESALI